MQNVLAVESHMMSNLKIIKHTEIAKIRNALSEEQGNRCAICGKVLTDPVLDHQHRMNKQQTLGEDGAGQIRGVLCRECNALEGKIWNAMNRYAQPKTVAERVEILEHIIEYWSRKPYEMIHPTERDRPQNVSKRQYNKLAKLTDVPEYPKSGKLTKELAKLFNKYNIHPYNKPNV